MASDSPPAKFLPVEAYEFYWDNPDKFVQDYILRNPEGEGGKGSITEQQRAFLRAVFDIKFGRISDGQGKRKFGVTVPAGHGVGKTTTLAFLIITWLSLFPTSKIPVTSTKKEQLADNLWPEVYKWLESSLLAEYIEWQKTKIFWRGAEETRFAVARTGSTQEALQGFHDEHLLFMVEEASGVENPIFEPVEGALTNEGAVMVLAGNPTRRSGYFYDSFTSDSRFHKIRISCIGDDGNPHPLVSQDYIDRMGRKFGKESSVYRVRVLGLPPKADDDAIIPMEWVEEARDRNIPVLSEYRKLWGVDPAVTGDRCGFCERIGSVVTKIDAWRNLNTMQIAGRVKMMYDDLVESERPHEIIVDIIGVGRGVYDRLKEMGLPARGVAVSEVPAVKTRFRRLRDELWWKVREWFETHAVKIPYDNDDMDDDELFKELTTPKYWDSSDGKIIVEPKRDFKNRLGGNSPDKADALCLTFATGIELIRQHTRDKYRDSQPRRNTSWMAA